MNAAPCPRQRDRPVTVRLAQQTALPLLARLALGVILVLGLVFNLSNPPGMIGFLPNAIVGAVLVVRRRGEAIGWLLLLMAAGYSVVGRTQAVEWAIANGNEGWLPLLAWL